MPIEGNIDDIRRNKTIIRYFIRPGIQSYTTIMELFSARDKSLDLLCHFFFDFYGIRGLKAEVQKACFKCFLDDTTRNFPDLLDAMRVITKRNEFSLTTKLYHTVHPSVGIIIDEYVREFCGRTRELLDRRLLENIRSDFQEDSVRNLAKVFDELFENDRGISQLKKIDFMIWGWGKWKKFEEKYPLHP